jgi:hypothetical protein
MTADDLLITQSDFENHVQISEEIPYDKYMTPFVRAAQLYDILPVLGNAFYVDLVTNIAEQEYVDLLTGKTYTDSNGAVKVFFGLKKAICLFAFSRWCHEANINATSFGLVTKISNQSEPVDPKYAGLRANREKEKAVAALQTCIDYICSEGATVYPLYFQNNSPKESAPSRSGVKIRSASRLDNNT